ncbi:hypothetical protein AAX09_07710 [Moraxella bovoculi]|uniref:hypothetical protein n=1 Tax=Moraxella bovoculi TaxID=386891 RepID=UPI0006246B46|nr:hypothetical protein [Moraxella bovoculi]AKG19276.1 hypothetical protein AAX09_07710 [Moraxella bovoculi]
MSKLLTAPEVVQALLAGKDVECTRAMDSQSNDWYSLNQYETSISMLTNGLFIFRLAQEKVTIGDVSFPKPVSEPLKKGTKYWFAGLGSERCAFSYDWDDDETDKRILRRGLLHLSEENAVAHAKALIKLSGGTIDE